MTRALFVVAAIAVCGSLSLGADQTFPLTGDNAKVTFVGTKPGGKHQGGFSKLSGTATVSDGDPATLKIEVTIDTDSLYSDNPMLTTHLKSPDFFAVKDHPKAKFKTTKVEKTDKGYTITGELTMLGKTKPVVMPATVSVTGDTLTLTSEFQIDRNDWGMSYGRGKVDDKVSLKVVVNAKK
ncbi:MAG TPA: YceI family protein [Gemmataceae bacterium]|nr:YceI family protein [Gemmataceae bacterium]